MQDSGSLVRSHEAAINALAEQVEALRDRLLQLDDLLSPSGSRGDGPAQSSSEADADRSASGDTGAASATSGLEVCPDETARETSEGVGSWKSRVGPQSLFTWEDTTYQIFGIEPGTPVRNIDLFNLVHPDDRMRLVEAVMDSRSHPGSEETTVRVRLPEGSLRHVLFTVAADFDDDGAPVGLRGTVQDVTDR